MPTLMLALFLSVTTLLTATSTNAATVRFDQFPNASLLSPNLTGHNPDPRFKLEAHYTAERLPATAVLMNTMTLLTEAADMDFDGLVDIDKETTFDDYPAVMIDMQSAKAHNPLPACFWVWALYGAALDMIERTKFFVSEFDLTWKGKIVGRLKYYKTSRRGGASTIDADAGSPSNTSANILRDKPYLVKKDTTNRTKATTFTIATPNNTAVPSTITTDSQLTVTLQYLDNAKELPIWTMFVAVFATLKDNAKYAATARVAPFETTVRGFDASLYILRNEGPPITRPPFFERTHVTHAVRELPAYMLAEKRIAEIAITIELDGKELGNGLLIKGTSGHRGTS